MTPVCFKSPHLEEALDRIRNELYEDCNELHIIVNGSFVTREIDNLVASTNLYLRQVEHPINHVYAQLIGGWRDDTIGAGFEEKIEHIICATPNDGIISATTLHFLSDEERNQKYEDVPVGEYIAKMKESPKHVGYFVQKCMDCNHLTVLTWAANRSPEDARAFEYKPICPDCATKRLQEAIIETASRRVAGWPTNMDWIDFEGRCAMYFTLDGPYTMDIIFKKVFMDFVPEGQSTDGYWAAITNYNQDANIEIFTPIDLPSTLHWVRWFWLHTLVSGMDQFIYRTQYESED